MENLDGHIEHCKTMSKKVEDEIDEISQKYDELSIEYWKWIGAMEYLEEFKKINKLSSNGPKYEHIKDSKRSKGLNFRKKNKNKYELLE